MADQNGKEEENWEYASEDGEDYSWEYETDEEGAEAPPLPASDPPKKEVTKEEPKPEPKVERKPVPTEEPKEAPKIERRSRASVAAEREKEEKVEEEEEDIPMRKTDRNAILEQMKRLQEGYNDLEVDISDISDLSESEEDEDDRVRPTPNEKVEKEEEDLSDLDLLDPFGSEPVPVVQKKPAPQNGHAKKDPGEERKHRKHRKKSNKHESSFEKFRNLEEKNGEDKDKSFKSQKIHVRSKDPSKIARQFEKVEKGKPSSRNGPRPGVKAPVKAPVVEVNKICKVCNKEPYVVERLVAEKCWWHKNCFRCKECNKLLSLDTYASHQGVIYCKPHQRDLFKPKAVSIDLTEEIAKKNLDFASYDVDGDIVQRHKKQERRMETIVRENNPVELKGVIKSKVDDSKWEGLDKLDVGSKFQMFENKAEDEKRTASDRYGIMEKLKRLQAGEDVSDLLAEIDDEMPSDGDGEEEDPDEYGLTEVQKKAHRSEKLFDADTKKEKLAMQRKAELKKLREKLMAGTRDSVLDSFDELNHRKIKKTEIDVRGTNAKKFMSMFDQGEVPEGMSAGDKNILEKDAELAMMRSRKRDERDFFKKMEKGETKKEEIKEPKLLIGKLRDNWMDKDEEEHREPKTDPNLERMHAAKECKASAVLNKFKDMEKRIANGEDLDDESQPVNVTKYSATKEKQARNRPLPRRFTPPRRLGDESGSEYSDSEYSYSCSDSESDDYSSDGYENGKDAEENEYLRNVREAARAKQLRAKFEEWEAQCGEDGGYTNLVDENGLPLETASKLKDRFENLAISEPAPSLGPPKRFQVKRFKPKEAYEYQKD